MQMLPSLHALSLKNEWCPGSGLRFSGPGSRFPVSGIRVSGFGLSPSCFGMSDLSRFKF